MPISAPVPIMHPISELRTNLPGIEKAARESGEPIVLTRNGVPSLVLFDSDAYNERLQRERHIWKLREAELEARYRSGTVSLSDSRARIREMRAAMEALNA